MNTAVHSRLPLEPEAGPDQARLVRASPLPRVRGADGTLVARPASGSRGSRLCTATLARLRGWGTLRAGATRSLGEPNTKREKATCVVSSVVTGGPVNHESTVGCDDRLEVSGGHVVALCL